LGNDVAADGALIERRRQSGAVVIS
jgi:hypothetical protein